jgi:hypothetical protein
MIDMRSSYAAIVILNLIGGVASVGFGVWHLFVPKIWKWYSYIQTDAKELVVAIRAINVFFSVSLILFGIMSNLLVIGKNSNKYSLVVVIGSIVALWTVRVIMQLIYPQGTMNVNLQYGMLISFILILLCYIASLLLIIKS